jgi:hypothetical protein
MAMMDARSPVAGELGKIYNAWNSNKKYYWLSYWAKFEMWHPLFPLINCSYCDGRVLQVWHYILA